MMTSFHLRNWCGHLRPLHFRDNILMTTMARNIISTILICQTFLVPTIAKISLPKTSRDYFSLVAKLLRNVLVKNSIAVWQRRTEILRTV